VPIGLARLFGWEFAATVPESLPEGTLVVVHLPDPDDAAHARDRAGKIAAIERLDAVVGDLLTLDADVTVCPDHGCDPATGTHTAEPVPALSTRPGGGAARFTERAVAHLPVRDPREVVRWPAA
jgi:2,3-bisphosphoglycerate-independent phosphoglycerate mutase